MVTQLRVRGGILAASVGVWATVIVACAGCTAPPAQPSRPFDGEGAAQAYVAERQPEAADTIRVHSIQRLADRDDASLTATVSIRNVGSAARTVTVVVTWLTRDRTPVGNGAESRQTITLIPQETKLLTFEGAAEARDFKVSLSYAGT